MINITTKWYSTKREKQLAALEKARKVKASGKKIKYSRSYLKLIQRAKLLEKPSVVGVSAAGIKTTNKDVQKYLKKNKLTIKAGIIRKQ